MSLGYASTTSSIVSASFFSTSSVPVNPHSTPAVTRFRFNPVHTKTKLLLHDLLHD
ncbi:hypothetical protein RvY_00524 [Ramazzottius varieornatus]|uniref:Uncharacterized protein n=1 Tax=Ramazzottius varieornatus TaxID=947166 RepID=A0A1D1UD25_RAMVA|nr:hypothetical protein RvY_00524 [Ramazzottius varieornatus]